ncbi:major intrinsic protein, partial [Planoprotostelium fungivorum]
MFERKITRFGCRPADLKSWVFLWRAIVGEFVGTFILVYAGLGSILAGQEILYVAISWSLTISVLISVFGKISMALFNPIITMVFWLLKDITLFQALLSVIAQLLGSVTAASLHLVLWPLGDFHLREDSVSTTAEERNPYYLGCNFVGGDIKRGLISE